MDDEPDRRRAALRGLAHPVRLRIMSLLTGAPLTAAGVARELGLTHANASYHLRNLLSAGLIVLDGEERIRGGVAKRYRYDALRAQREDREPAPERRATYVAIANDLIRRAAQGDWEATGRVLTDAEVWVDPDVVARVRAKLHEASQELHLAARPPRTPGTVRTGLTVAMFQLAQE